MKNIFALILTFTLCLSLCSCKKDCDYCNNTGIRSCIICDSGRKKCTCVDGYIACDWCKKNPGYYGSELCSTCDGDGKIINPYTWEVFDCPTCDCEGRVPKECTKCEGEGHLGEICTICNGTEHVTCSYCNGTGERACENCNNND